MLNDSTAITESAFSFGLDDLTIRIIGDRCVKLSIEIGY
jgi:hypothetical protein